MHMALAHMAMATRARPARVVYYNYPAGGVGAALGRLDNTASAGSPNASQKYASYMYLGAGTVVKVAYPENRDANHF